MPVSERPRIKRETVTVRIEPQLRNLVDRAAELTGRRRTELVLDFARRAAEETILDGTMFMVAPQACAAFLARLDPSPKPNARLCRALQSPARWN